MLNDSRTTGDLMMRFAIRSILATPGAFPFALAICLLQPRPVSAQEQKVRVIELSAKKYEYSGSPLHVKAGTKVQLKITATDHDHGFKVHPTPDGVDSTGSAGIVFASPQECWQLKKGETTTIEFLAQAPGTYTFKCCHRCGLGHGGMKGQIVVDQ
jgi:cytochrome c oxidase subunit 2